MKIMIKVDYRGIEIVKCTHCGYEYPIDQPWCPECGSCEVEFIRREEG